MAKKKEQEVVKKTTSSPPDKDIQALFAKFKDKVACFTYAGENLKPLDILSTGSLLLDYKLPYGGFPRKRIIHLFGPTRSLKSTIAIKTIKSAFEKNPDALCMILDFERTMDHEGVLDFFIYLGLTEDQAKRVLIVRDDAESCFDLACDFVQLEKAAVLVVDSIGAIEPSNTVDKQFNEHEKMASRAKLVKRFLTIVNQKNNNCAIIVLNHIMDNIGTGPSYGPTYTYGGGNALKHMPSISLDLRGSHIKENKTDRKSANSKIALNVKVDKCKIGGENQNIALSYDLTTGQFDKIEELIFLGKEIGVIRQAGAWVYVMEEPNSDALLFKGQGELSLVEELKKDESLRDHVEGFVRTLMKDRAPILPNYDESVEDDNEEE